MRSPASTLAHGTTPNRDAFGPMTPGKPRQGEDAPFRDDRSEMDFSRVDPEHVLVDWETVQPVDISGEVAENFLRTAASGNKDDKVLVSIRVRPSEAPSAWEAQANTRSIKLLPNHHRNAATSPPIFNYDEILTG